MTPDSESHGWIAFIVTSLAGIGGFIWRSIFVMSNETSNLKARMRSSEHRLSEHDEKINVLEKNCAQVTENLKTLGADMHTVKGGVKKLVDHVTGTNLG